jgi:META domain
MRAAIWVLLAVTCSACTSSQAQPATSTSQAPVQPSERRAPADSEIPTATAPASLPAARAGFSGAFSASSYQDASGEHFLVGGTSFIVEFAVDGGRDIIRWSGGCNTSGTTYTDGDGNLHLDRQIGSTTVLCAQRLIDQDRFLSQFLLAAPKVAISASSLRLVESDVMITFAPTSKAPTWTLRGGAGGREGRGQLGGDVSRRRTARAQMSL